MVKKLSYSKGFTLIEIMAVMILIAILAATGVVGISAQMKKGKINATKTQIATFGQAISLFELECGFFPTSLNELIQAPTARRCKGYPQGGYMAKKNIPEDPWGNDYQYDGSGSRSGSGYDLWSLGPDAEDGTDDDITSWYIASDDDQE